MRLKRTPLDAAVSDLVRERANWTCEYCGYIDVDGQAKGSSMQIQCSHFYGRSHNSTRYHLDNCFCLCASCHSKLETRPAEHTLFVRNVLGNTRLEMLQKTHYQTRKWTKAERKEATTHYRSEFNRIRDLRRDGQTGYLEAVNYE